MSDTINENLQDLIPGGAPLGDQTPAVPAPMIGSVVLPCGAPRAVVDNEDLVGASPELQSAVAASQTDLPTGKPMVKLRRVSAPTGPLEQGPVEDGKRSEIIIDGKLIAEVPTRTVLWLTKFIEMTVSFLPTLVPFERRQELRGAPVSSTRGAKGRKVRVSLVDDDCDQPHQVGDIFDSASSASVSVGLTPNALCIAMRLSNAKGENLAKLRGVTFQYEDDYQHEINGEGRASD